MRLHSKEAQTSAALIHIYRSSGTMLPMRIVNIGPQSSRKFGWICDQCPDGHLHSWSAKVSNRTNGNGCPQCSGQKVCKHKCLATKDPLVAAQWDHEKNEATPDSVVAQSNQPAHWHCDACGHEWRAKISARVSKNKSGCPQCAKAARIAKKVKHPTMQRTLSCWHSGITSAMQSRATSLRKSG